jgi:serine/threonine protein kinase
MAPEQFLANESSEKVDIYALGVTLLELLAGRQLARAPLQPEPFAAHVRAALARPLEGSIQFALP